MSGLALRAPCRRTGEVSRKAGNPMLADSRKTHEPAMYFSYPGLGDVITR
jgi:hypothetical protein